MGFVLLFLAFAAFAAPQAEVTMRETAPTFQVRTNLVLVPVVVRDAQGNAVGNLTREDFQLFDKGKPQTITRFTIEKPEISESPGVQPPGDSKTPGAAIPRRFVAFLFDDIHLTLAHLTYARQAAEGHLANSLQPTDRYAILTSSGQTALDFTGDRPRLRAALAELRVRPSVDLERRDCPNLSFYQADQMIRLSNKTAVDTATLAALSCSGLEPGRGQDAPAILEQARNMARAAAQRVIVTAERDTRASLNALRILIRRMTATPGRRTLVLVSPGFFSVYARRQLSEIIDAAVRGGVIVHTLDASGLALADSALDASVRSVDPSSLGLVADGKDGDPNPLMGARDAQTAMIRETLNANREPMVSLSDGTGGTYFHNQNDLELGFQRTAGGPAFRYVLGFTPESLKSDGTYHELKVSLRNARGLSVNARRGYFAPTGAADPAETAKQEIEDALFSRERIRDLPAEVHTQFFKPSDDKARLSVVARIDVKQAPFRKVDGRNWDELTVISAVFDRNGNYVAGVQKKVEMRLKDETLAGEEGPPVTVKSNFDLIPGDYIVRVVVREAEGRKIAAENAVVEIPW